MKHVLLTMTAAISLSACTDMAAPPASASSQAAWQSPSQVLAALFARSDEAALQRNPLEALGRGDYRSAGRMPELFSDAYDRAEREAAEQELAALRRIDAAALMPAERISYEVFKWQRETDLRGLQPDLLVLTAVRPLNHFYGIHAGFAQLSSGEGAAPFKTVEDYQNGISRMAAFPSIIDRAIVRMRQGMASGVVQPKLVMRNVVEQLDAMLAEGVEDSSFYRPLKAFRADVPAADQARLKGAYAQAIGSALRPALQRLRSFVADEYLPKARDSVGLGQMPGGDRLYEYLVKVNTTTDLSADQIHRIGLNNVARIHAEMETVKARVGFAATLKEFFEHIRTDPKFKPASREALQQGYVAIGKRVETQLPRLFRTLPKTGLEIRPVPALTEKGAARGSYSSGTPDGSRPGVFYFNAYDLPSRTTPGMETLYLHEGAPGHHFQISLAQENVSLPSFQRFGGNTAFVEGWGLYAETLGPELGVYTDPYQYFGYLDSQLFRAIRLVVDTGIHSKGWTRDQTIQYILDNSSRGRSNATAETERYIAIPGQALAYKIGQLKISELRKRAETALGARFDLRDFHEQVLMSGALPLAVLEAKIDRWIASKRA